MEFIDYAQKTYGSKVKFLNFPEALARLEKNALAGHALRAANGGDAGRATAGCGWRRLHGCRDRLRGQASSPACGNQRNSVGRIARRPVAVDAGREIRRRARQCRIPLHDVRRMDMEKRPME